MIISCPDCATRYNIAEERFSSAGQRVRCQSCDSVWFQGPIEDQSTSDIDQVDESQPIDIETEAARLLSISKTASQQQHNKRQRLTSAIGGWAVLAACVTIFLTSGYIWRHSIVKTFPAAADIYARVYLPVNIRGIEFQNIVYENRYENGVPMLTIRGELVNISANSVVVPRLRFAVSDGSDQELYHWTMKVRRKSLPMDGRTKFVARLASPPREAQHVHVRFATIKERLAGIN